MNFENNSRILCGKYSWYFNMRYFCAKDLIDRDKTETEYHLAERMLIDFFTKLLQGALFKKFRVVITRYESVSSLF